MHCRIQRIEIHYAADVPATGVTLDTNYLELNVGQKGTLQATVAPNNATYKNVTWSSSDKNVATVSGGTVTAKSAGRAYIYATTKDGNHKDSCLVKVLNNVSYISPVYNTAGTPTSGINHWDTLSCKAYDPVTSSTTTWGTAGQDTWYVVKSNVDINDSVTCVGNVHLILMDGYTLNTKTIKTGGTGNSFTVYAQDTASSVMGVLDATAGSYEAAGIGGGKNGYGSNITINGGNVTASGGNYAAGIGGAELGYGSNITINGGIVTAIGGYYAAGIGGGYHGDGSNITINGGRVTANGDDEAAGIGGGGLGTGSSIIINGGNVTAQGGSNGAGIGGGENHNGSGITINGGKVTAQGGSYGAGIGGGNKGTGSNITINGGNVTAQGGSDNIAGIGNGYSNSNTTAASNIFVADSIILKADTSTNPPTTVIAHASVTTDVASSLTGKRYVTTEEIFFFVANGDWDVASNWSSNSVPTAANAVTINAQCTIPSGCDAVCNDMKINSPLYVAPTASLVATSIDNATAANLFIASDEDGTGTVKFTSGTATKATVQMYFKGHATKDNNGNMVDPEWQYRGFIGTPDEGQSLSDIAIYRWDETKNDSNCWVGRIAPGTSANFIETVGYSMANYTSDVATRTYTTTLLPVDDISYSCMTFTGSVETPNRGVHLITNSMSAPINLSDNGIRSDSLESTVYLFNTRSYNSWKSDTTAAITTYPLYSGTAIADDHFIPAGQSFAVKASADGASLTFPASAFTSDNSGAMHAPREESEFGILAITAESADGVDDLFLLESDICDAKFNNGYDGTKMFASNAPQIYATNDYGMTAVNADNTLLGQYIGVRQGSTSNSITMTISRRDLDNYTSLSLYDCVSGTYYDLADDETTITVTATGDQPRRFLISGKRDDGTLYTPTESGSLVVAGDQLMLVNFGRSDAQIMLTDASGKMLWSENSKNGNTFTLPQLPAGVYFISCGKVSTKYITK